MSDRIKVRSAEEVLEAVRWAVSGPHPLEVAGQGSKAAIGRPVQAESTLDLSELTGVTLYEPEELVLSARAGTPLSEIEALLEEHGQELAFEPMDAGPLFGGEPGRATLGGVLAADLSGPRRLKAGAARDHVLGVHAVSGRGEAFKSGGRVVKNVTGYDLSKGLAGSWGTLAVVTDLTFKVLPRGETEASLLLEGQSATEAVASMARAMGSPLDVSSAAWLPAGMLGQATSVTLLRLEGFARSVAHRGEKLRDLLAGQGNARITGEREESRRLWRSLRDAEPFAGTDRPVWRISVPPSGGARVVETVEALGGRAYMDWAGGLVWAEAGAGDVAHETELRGCVTDAGGGHATLLRAPASVRAAVEVFQPQPAPLAALSRRLKMNFDPQAILNPGRMAAGL